MFFKFLTITPDQTRATKPTSERLVQEPYDVGSSNQKHLDLDQPNQTINASIVMLFLRGRRANGHEAREERPLHCTELNELYRKGGATCAFCAELSGLNPAIQGRVCGEVGVQAEDVRPPHHFENS